MCSPSNVSCHTKTSRQQHQQIPISTTSDTRRQQQQRQPQQAQHQREGTPRDVTNTTNTPTLLDPSNQPHKQQVATRPLTTDDDDDENTHGSSSTPSTMSSHLVYHRRSSRSNTTRAHSPQYCVEPEEMGLHKTRSTMTTHDSNAVRSNAQRNTAHGSDLHFLSHNSSTEGSNHRLNSTDMPSLMRSERREQQQQQQQQPLFPNTPSPPNTNNHHPYQEAQLVRNPKLPPPLVLSSDQRHHPNRPLVNRHHDSSKDVPSPRDVSQHDMHLYQRPNLASPQHRTYHHHPHHGHAHGQQQQQQHQQQVVEYPPSVPRVSLSQMYPPHGPSSSYGGVGGSRSPPHHNNNGETRQESSPMSSASNSSSSVASPEEWSLVTGSLAAARDPPHASPQQHPHQHPNQHPQQHQQQPYMSPPMYRQPQPRQARVPFHLKPRPNTTTYRTPQKQYPQNNPGGYSPYYHTPPQPVPYRSTNSSPLNTLTTPPPPHHTRHTTTTNNNNNNPHTTTTPSPTTPTSTPHSPLTPSTNTNTNTNTTTSTPTPTTQPPTRTAPEILKTLLRKKACLYEPGTSRAITLLTWIVARSLALKYGYFSRQHLQTGVHTIVKDKIAKGIITRTKVNRCMQVILNSCFYYIIPKPDGTEESGESFRRAFGETVGDDTGLLRTLTEPWDDLEWEEDGGVERDCVSPVLVEMKGGGGGGGEEEDKSPFNSKRQVLLCFNENVRCAEDVLRCHNDFIRDSAISANLVLTPEEWRSFYLCKDESPVVSPTSVVTTTTTTTTKGVDTNGAYNIHSFNIPPADVEKAFAFKENSGDDNDAMGQMTTSELGQFRTTWCCKRYDHDATLCRFAHIDVNKGWLRRNPSQYEYSTTMCPKTRIVANKTSTLDGCYLNACPDGMRCQLAHSQEEVEYHPKNYKVTVCDSVKKGSCRTCDMRDICPKLHPVSGPHSCSTTTPPRPITRHCGRRSNDTHIRIKGHLISGKHHTPSIGSTDVGSCVRSGAPMLYLGPAPTCDFDKTLYFPGLCALYRRNCATYYAQDVGGDQMEYSNFGAGKEVETNLTEPSVAKSVAGGDFSLFARTFI